MSPAERRKFWVLFLLLACFLLSSRGVSLQDDGPDDLQPFVGIEPIFAGLSLDAANDVGGHSPLTEALSDNDVDTSEGTDDAVQQPPVDHMGGVFERSPVGSQDALHDSQGMPMQSSNDLVKAIARADAERHLATPDPKIGGHTQGGDQVQAQSPQDMFRALAGVVEEMESGRETSASKVRQRVESAAPHISRQVGAHHDAGYGSKSSADSEGANMDAREEVENVVQEVAAALGRGQGSQARSTMRRESSATPTIQEQNQRHANEGLPSAGALDGQGNGFQVVEKVTQCEGDECITKIVTRKPHGHSVSGFQRKIGQQRDTVAARTALETDTGEALAPVVIEVPAEVPTAANFQDTEATGEADGGYGSEFKLPDVVEVETVPGIHSVPASSQGAGQADVVDDIARVMQQQAGTRAVIDSGGRIGAGGDKRGLKRRSAPEYSPGGDTIEQEVRRIASNMDQGIPSVPRRGIPRHAGARRQKPPVADASLTAYLRALNTNVAGDASKVSQALRSHPGTCSNFTHDKNCAVPLTGNEVAVTGPILIGSKASKIDCIFDTGSKDLIIKNVEYDPHSHTLISAYNHEHSETYQSFHTQAAVGYGSGDAAVLVGADDVKIGDRVVPQMMMGEIFAEKGLTIMHYGELGMDFPNIECILGLMHMKKPLPRVQNEHSVFDRMRANGVESFGYCVKNAGEAEVLLNDQTHIEKEVPVVSDFHWATELSEVGFGKPGEKKLSMCTGEARCSAIMDTGTSIITGPHQAVQEIAEMLQVKPDCSNLHELPDLTFKLGDHEFTLDPSAYVVQVEQPVIEAKIFLHGAIELEDPANDQNGQMTRHCTLGLRPADATLDGTGTLGGSTMWIMGQPFFEQYYTRYAWPTGGKPVHDTPSSPGQRRWSWEMAGQTHEKITRGLTENQSNVVGDGANQIPVGSSLDEESQFPFMFGPHATPYRYGHPKHQPPVGATEPRMYFDDARQRCGTSNNMNDRLLVKKTASGQTEHPPSLVVEGRNGRPSWTPRLFRRPEDILGFRRWEAPGGNVPIGLGVMATGI